MILGLVCEYPCLKQNGKELAYSRRYSVRITYVSLIGIMLPVYHGKYMCFKEYLLYGVLLIHSIPNSVMLIVTECFV